MINEPDSVDKMLNLLRLIAIIESSDDAIIGHRLDGTITSWNTSASILYGFSAEEAVGKPISIIVPPELRDEMAGLLERIRRGEKINHHNTVHLRMKDGTKLNVSVTILPVRDKGGNIVGASTIARDITETKRVIEERERIFNLSIDLVMISGFDGYFKELNPACMKTLGWSKEELRSKPYIEFVHPDDRELTVASESTLVNDKLVLTFMNRFRCKDGSYRWISWNSYPFPEEKLIFSAARDVTTEKKLEDFNKEINRKLQETNKELDTFAYSASHDLRAPLRSIDGFSKIMLEDYVDKVDDVGKDYLRRIRAASQLMGQLIDDMLNLSRISRGEFKKETVDLSKIANDIALELKSNSPSRDANFIIADGLIVRGDPHLLKIALENLLGNAWKFTSRHPAATIEFGTVTIDGKKAFFVKDNGAGFDMTYIKKMFIPFQRLHSTEEFPGIGIGLATIRRILDRHGGTIWAEGAVEEGATFYFTLEEEDLMFDAPPRVNGSNAHKK
jgi:PAS domain S-box-containing protein